MTITDITRRALALGLTAATLILCTSCGSTPVAEQPAPAAVVDRPKEWTGTDEPARPLPPIQPAAISIAPATMSTELAAVSPATRPADELRLDRPATKPAEKLQADNEPQQPGPDNTGVADQKNLKISQKVMAVNGNVIENLFITGGVVANDTHNVVIRNCVIDAAGGRYGVMAAKAQGLVIEHCEIYNMTEAGVYGDGFTAKWNVVYQSGGDGFKPGHDCVIEANWVHTLGYKNPSAHSDGVQIRGGSNVKVVGNYFDLPLDKPETKSNSAVFIQGFAGRNGSSDILVEGNWCKGGNFAIHGFSNGADPATIRIVNNHFYRGSPRYGFAQLEAGVVWKGNTYEDGESRANPSDK